MESEQRLPIASTVSSNRSGLADANLCWPRQVCKWRVGDVQVLVMASRGTSVGFLLTVFTADNCVCRKNWHDQRQHWSLGFCFQQCFVNNGMNSSRWRLNNVKRDVVRNCWELDPVLIPSISLLSISGLSHRRAQNFLCRRRSEERSALLVASTNSFFLLIFLFRVGQNPFASFSVAI